MSADDVNIDEVSELTGVEDLFSTQIRGKVDPIWRLQRSLERANVLMTGDNVDAFESSVRAALSDLPASVNVTVMVRTEEFNSEVTEEIREYWCGVVVREFDEDGKELPLKTRKYTTTDYEKLFSIIKEQLEFAGGSWQYEKTIKKSLKIQEALPREIIRIIVKNRVNLLTEIREKYPDLSIGYMDLDCGWSETPATPVFEAKEK